jgi:hypothetical protein
LSDTEVGEEGGLKAGTAGTRPQAAVLDAWGNERRLCVRVSVGGGGGGSSLMQPAAGGR